MDKPWFNRWFGEAYKRLYPHRDFKEAELQVAFVLRELPVTFKWRILDVGCGQGRHLKILRDLGYLSSFGLDLSIPLLRDARSASQQVIQGDMRHLPFPSNSFDWVNSFFTSFGYFATFAEDVEALSQFVSVLKPGGWLFLDLINKDHLLSQLVSEDTCVKNQVTVTQRRRLELSSQTVGAGPQTETVVVKEIEIQKPGSEIEKFEERVRLYSQEDMSALANQFSLRIVKTFGDEKGMPFHKSLSPRMALLFQKGE